MLPGCMQLAKWNKQIKKGLLLFRWISFSCKYIVRGNCESSNNCDRDNPSSESRKAEMMHFVFMLPTYLSDAPRLTVQWLTQSKPSVFCFRLVLNSIIFVWCFYFGSFAPSAVSPITCWWSFSALEDELFLINHLYIYIVVMFVRSLKFQTSLRSVLLACSARGDGDLSKGFLFTPFTDVWRPALVNCVSKEVFPALLTGN